MRSLLPAIFAVTITLLLLTGVSSGQGFDRPVPVKPETDPARSSEPLYSPDDISASNPDTLTSARTIWDSDSLLFCNLDSLKLGNEINRPVRGPFRLPPRPSRHALGIIFADGRPSRWDSLYVYGSNRYWSADRACNAVGASLAWDPELMRGEIKIDSLSCGFVVGGEVIHCGPLALQMGAPVIYIDNRLLLPLDFIKRMTETTLSQKFHYNSAAKLLVQISPLPASADLYIQQIGNRTYIKWPLSAQPEAKISLDGAFGITVSIPDVYINPEKPPEPKARRGSCLWSIVPTPRGTDFTFRVGPAIKAWRLKWHADHNELGLTLTSNAADLAYRTYFPWTTPAVIPSSDSITDVILIIPGNDTGDDVSDLELDAVCCIRDTGEQIKLALEESGYSVLLLTDTERSNLVPALNAQGARLCLMLKPLLAGDRIFPGCNLVAAPDRPGTRPFALFDRDAAPGSGQARQRTATSQSETLAMRPWRRIAPAHAGSVREFSSLLSIFLRDAFAPAPIRCERWPLLNLEGLDMPALALYLGDLNGHVAITGSNRIEVPERFSQAVTLSIGTFLERSNLHSTAP